MIRERNLIIFYLVIFVTLTIVGLFYSFKAQASIWFLLLEIIIMALTVLSIAFYTMNFRPKRYMWLWKIVPFTFILFNLWDMYRTASFIILPLWNSIAVWSFFFPAIYISFRFGFPSERRKWLPIKIITGIIALICLVYFLPYFFGMPPPRTSNPYNSMAKNALRTAIVIQKADFAENETFTKSIARLTYTLGLKKGIVFRIISADKSHFKMVSYHENGNKGFLSKGPDTTIEEIPKAEAIALLQMDRDVIEPSTDRLIRDLKSNDPDIRADAAYYLTKSVDKKAILPLIEALKDKDPFVRRYAAKALGSYQEPSIVAPLINAINDIDKEDRTHAISVLGEMKESKAVEPIINALADWDWDVRKRAAEALGKIGDTRAVEPLIESLNHDDWEIRKYAVMALGEIKDRRAVDPLIRILNQDKNKRIRYNIIMTLGNIGGDKVENTLQDLLNDEDKSTRKQAEMVIKEINRKKQ